MAKAMLDGRLLDLPVSPLFWSVMLGVKLTLDDLRDVYPEAYSVLSELAKGDGCKYDPSDLSLSFTLVGQDDWELVPGGASLPLSRSV